MLEVLVLVLEQDLEVGRITLNQALHMLCRQGWAGWIHVEVQIEVQIEVQKCLLELDFQKREFTKTNMR